MKKTYIIGTYKNEYDGEGIVTMDAEIREIYNEPEKTFSACFNVGELVNVDERDARDYYEYLFEDSDAESKLYYLQDGDITKEEFIENAINEEYDYRDRIDCSCTDYEFTKDGATYNFETIACGQHDAREDEGFEPIREEVKELFKLWDNYHLKTLSPEDEKTINETLKRFEDLEDIEEKIEELFNAKEVE